MEKTKIRVGIFAAVGIAALVAVLVALCFFMPTPMDLKLTSNYMIGGISLVAVALTAGTAVAVKKFKLKLPVACKKQSERCHDVNSSVGHVHYLIPKD